MLGIKEFFAKKNLFITGATGFLGKVLIEKLLRNCPDIGNIYILIRTKGNKVLEERVQALLADPLFDILKEKDIEQLKKVKPISGDIAELNLGISEEDQTILIENVHIVYHIAASIRFDDHLRFAILTNVRSTKLLIELAHKMKNLVLFVHVSTTFCNIDRNVVEEKLYPAHGNWREVIELAEDEDNRQLECMAPKYIYPFPNTYVYTKSLAEHVVDDLCRGRIPAIIIRPSIVINMLHDPIPGWTDNLNGPLGLGISAIKGVTRIFLGKNNTALDLIPVDNVIKIIIQASYKHGFLDVRKDNVEVYNASGFIYRTLEQMIQCAIDDVIKYPCQNILWYPNVSSTNCLYWYNFSVLLYHAMPAIFLDMLLTLNGKKPMLLKIQKKIYIANNALSHFSQIAWLFQNSKIHELESYVPESERETFCYPSEFKKSDKDQINTFQNICVTATCKYVFKEEKGEKYLPKLQRLRIMDVTCKTILVSALCWFFFVKLNLFPVLLPS